MTAQQPKTTKYAMVLPIILFGGMALGALYLGVSGIYWVATGDTRCLTAWDSRFQPQFVAGQCSILQAGYRVPTPDYLSLNEIRSPDARDY